MLNLNNKIALITGGSRGIGEAIAVKMAEYGADIVIISGSNPVNTIDKIKSFGNNAYWYRCDVSNYNESESVTKQILNDCGKVDILVNNAGITCDKLMIQMTEEDYDKVLDVNLKGTFNMIRHLSRPFIKQKSGRIINITSIIGMMGNAGQTNYAASKAGIIGLTKSAAKELASKNITCNAIAPGYIDTAMTGAMSDEAKDKLQSMIPLKRIGMPDDVANLAVFLASDMAAYITGEIIKTDGGLYI